ncbi:MAG: aspartate--ammonia ligase [Oscillospiraceae bacterium]|nr:aspartate--ammonia ligase [Oscillospiraceae bacterium]
MFSVTIPECYKPTLSLRETQRAIKLTKDLFERNLASALNLERVTAPLIVRKQSGINDDLSGIERKVHFTTKEFVCEAEIVQSLAKWKRLALYRYGFKKGEGLYTDMSAIRRDDSVDNLHSIYVDQWDWELVIGKEQRTIGFLKETVEKIVDAFVKTHKAVVKEYPALKQKFSEKVHFVTTQELEDMYPLLSSKQRENAITEKYKTVFIMQIGGALKSGNKHDGRAPDYDDRTLNGDLLMWSDPLSCAVELSSMGIRVDREALLRQLDVAGCNERLRFDYHSKIADETLPLTIGGGLGQSRICLIMLDKIHVGEVQSSIWPEEMIKECADHGFELL